MRYTIFNLGGPGWIRDVLKVEIRVDDSVPVVKDESPYAGVAGEIQDGLVPCLSSAGRLDGIVTIAAPEGHRVWYESIDITIEQVAATLDPFVSTVLSTHTESVRGGGYVENSIYTPFSLELQPYFLLATYSGKSFGIRHIVTVQINRPWYTFPVKSAGTPLHLTRTKESYVPAVVPLRRLHETSITTAPPSESIPSDRHPTAQDFTLADDTGTSVNISQVSAYTEEVTRRKFTGQLPGGGSCSIVLTPGGPVIQSEDLLDVAVSVQEGDIPLHRVAVALIKRETPGASIGGIVSESTVTQTDVVGAVTEKNIESLTAGVEVSIDLAKFNLDPSFVVHKKDSQEDDWSLRYVLRLAVWDREGCEFWFSTELVIVDDHKRLW